MQSAVKNEQNDEISKEMTLSKEEKIRAFDLLNWASVVACFMSVWQMVVPLILFRDNTAQLFLATTSFFFLIVSVITLYWSNKNFHFLKKDENEENPILPTWHIEGTIYVMSYILLACFVTFFIGILVEEDFSWAILVAKGTPIANAQKEAFIITVTECILIIADIVNLGFYIKYSYYLEFFPKHLPGILGYFLAAFIAMCSFTLGDQNYLQSNVGSISKSFVEISQDVHSQIFWTGLIGILVSMFFLYENRNIQQQQVPKVRFYFLPFILLIGVGSYLAVNSLKFVYYASFVNKKLTQNCKDLLQTYSETYVNSIGCPAKYQTLEVNSNIFYSQDCPTSHTGIVWELDKAKANTDKRNQISCLNIDCCYLLSQHRTINYKEFFLLSIMTAIIGCIAAGHCMDLAAQSSNKIKAGPSIYTNTKLASQWIVSLIAIALSIFLAFQSQPVVPETQAIIQSDSPLLKLNQHPQWFQKQNVLDSIPQCKHPQSLSDKPLQVFFSQDQCDDQAIKANKCSKETQGIYTCLNIINGVFQLDASWDGNRCRVIGSQIFDQYKRAQALNGVKINDQFCVYGEQDCVNDVISKSLYACSGPQFTPVITQTKNQVDIEGIFPKEEKKNNNPHPKAENTQHHKHLNNNRNLFDDHNYDSSLDQYGHFVDVHITVYDGATYKQIQNVTVDIYENVELCNDIDTSYYPAVRKITSQINGKAEIRNLMINPTSKYIFQVKADGYLYNCFIPDIHPQSKEVKYKVALVSDFEEEEIIKVLLHYQDNAINLELGANFALDQMIECNVGYFNEKCGGAIYQNLQSGRAQSARIITLQNLGVYNYLFYARLVPNDREARNVINNAAGLSMDSEDLKNEIESLFRARVFMNIYAKGSNYPISSYKMPSLHNEIVKSNLKVTWLSICINGAVGPSTQQTLNHFWTTTGAKTTNYWEYDPNIIKMLPSSDICRQFYESLKNPSNI